MTTPHIALLRGINVGGKNKLPMKTLVNLLEALGCTDVRTYIQSGNAVFSASPATAKKLPRQLAAAIDAKLGLRVPVLVREGAAFCRSMKKHPLAKKDSEDKHLHVMFLADRPTPAQVKKLDPNRSPGDTFRVVGQDLFVLCPNGVARSKLTNAWLDKALDTKSTARNWRTVQKLVALASTSKH